MVTALATMNQLPGQPSIAMFARCIQFMGTEEQKKEFLDKIYRY
jgi:hypothetical protein